MIARLTDPCGRESALQPRNCIHGMFYESQLVEPEPVDHLMRYCIGNSLRVGMAQDLDAFETAIASAMQVRAWSTERMVACRNEKLSGTRGAISRFDLRRYTAQDDRCGSTAAGQSSANPSTCVPMSESQAL